MNFRELDGKSYGCLPGCGFCCTFPAAVTPPERRKLQAAGKGGAVKESKGTLTLTLQGGCGACVLLKERACTAYAARPSPCRYFPFHVYFGRELEVYVDHTCRGVVRDPGSNLLDAFASHVTAHVPREHLQQEAAKARAVHGQFERLAREHGVWEDPDAALLDLLRPGPDLFTEAGMRAIVEAAGDDEAPGALLANAVEAWDAPNPVHRPYYLDPATRWLTYAREGTRLRVLELHEDGRFTRHHLVDGLTGWVDPAPAEREALYDYLRHLASRDAFLGGAFHLLDEHDYAAPLRQAIAVRLGEVVVDLVLRARLIPATLQRALPPAELAEEVARFYDSDFLDAPTIGGYL